MTTPLRQQYLRIKNQFPDVIVLFRLGDFYETFDDDAKIVSSVCNIVLTGRDMGSGERVPLAGVPYHAVDTYLSKLIQAGHKVAIVDQLETADDQALGKNLIARDVTRVVTPGTVVEPALLQEKANNYLVASAIEEGRAGIARVDITTGEFAATQIDVRDTWDELDRLHPAELIFTGREYTPPGRAKSTYPCSVVQAIDDDAAVAILKEHFGVASLDGFGLAGLRHATRAAAAIVRFLRENQKGALTQLRNITVYSTNDFMVLDPPTRRNLEIMSSIRGGGTRGSLLGVLDQTRTPMGGRLLRQWLVQPLRDLSGLAARLDRVEHFTRENMVRDRVRSKLRGVGDLARLINRAVQGIASPRELRALARGLAEVPGIISELGTDGATLDPCSEVSGLIGRALVDDPPATLTSGGAIAEGYSAELDSIQLASKNAKEWVAGLERKERERTGIKSLKVGYNRVFGYYLEVTTANIGQAPPDYIRKQTLANAERFITPELKEYESLILNAEERLVELESSLFRSLCSEVATFSTRILATAQALAELDVVTTFAEVAERNRYVRPLIDGDGLIEIQDGRHPVVETSLTEEPFVPNDCHLGGEQPIHIITGPNMSGKSTYLRQVALIVLMAQVGSFVPASSARIGLVDRIFTRIGAEDAISSGQSTFMVEMVETANILNHCTHDSLIVLDEIGRGTSTYDGIAIARSVVEYIHNHPRLGSRTLFATHYHEMTELEGYLPKVRNYNVAVVEQGERVVFLHKIVPGGADKSYGIHVAQLAGVPRPVVSRAQEILAELEDGDTNGTRNERGSAPKPIQLRLFSPDDDLRKELADLDVLALSPLEALTKLFELQRKAKVGN